jgi:hypothetical protein
VAVKRPVTPEALLAACPPHVAELADSLREIARGAVPDATEAGYGGWRAIGYRHPRAGYLFGIFLSDRDVKLFFEHGGMLPDPAGLMRGDSLKQGRYVDVPSFDSIDVDALQDLMREAVALRSAVEAR